MYYQELGGYEMTKSIGASMTIHTHGEIIAKFGYKSKYVFIVAGLENDELFSRIGLNSIILKNFLELKNLSQKQKQTLRKELKGKIIAYLTPNFDEFMEFLQSYRALNIKSNGVIFTDLKVVKAVELIPKDELYQNAFMVGLELDNDSFSGYLVEVVKQARHEPTQLQDYIKQTLLKAVKYIEKRG